MCSSTSYRKPSKTVYILGAGFSKPAGIPVLSQFIPQAFSILKASRNPALLERFGSLVNTYRAAANQMQLDSNNLETLFCLSDISEQRNRDRADLVQVIAKTVFESCNCHKCDRVSRDACCVPPGHLAPNDTAPPPNHPSVEYGVCIYKAFLSHIFYRQRKLGGDQLQVDDLHTVITFNYDLVLEEVMKDDKDCCVCYGENVVKEVISPDEFWSAGGAGTPSRSPRIRRSTYGQFPHRTLHYLKLHGSLNWVAEDSANCLYVTARPIDAARKGRGYNEIPLVPPTWKRGSRDGDIYAKMLSEAIEHLRIASRIVIIGYSMPNTDTYFRYVLATALHTPEFPQVEVWDVRPWEEVERPLQSIFGPNRVGYHEGQVRYENYGLSGFVHQETVRLRKELNKGS